MKPILFLIPVALFLLPMFAAAQQNGGDSTIHVDASRILNHITPWMYGSCIEDVNHEIYGGLYAQLIFGESFEEEPVSLAPIAGWKAYGGQWRVQDGRCRVEANAGAKLVRDTPQITDGTVECDIRFPEKMGTNAGLILRVSDPRTGADTWTGYEISLSAQDNNVSLSRHRNDWHLLRAVPTPIAAGQWHHLRVELTGPTLRLYLDQGAQDTSHPVLEYTDDANAILTGSVGLRTWNANAEFRNLNIRAAQNSVTERFENGGISAPPQISGMWDAVQTGNAAARYVWDADNPFNSARSQQITYEGNAGNAGIAVNPQSTTAHPQSRVGIANRGLNRWGIAVHAGQRYAGHLYARAKEGAGAITVALQNADGTQTYAQQRLNTVGTDWTRREFSLPANTTDPGARFAIWIDRPGTVWIDQVYLSPTGKVLFHNLPVRADIGNKLVEQGLTFLRYGGSMVNAPTYRWKQMIGSRDKRPQTKGWWYSHSTNGFGIEEFLQFCEAAHIEPAFAINIDETPQDAADIIAYLNGPATSEWGRKRAQNGHPRPYGVRYIEIGNEEAIDGNKAWYARYLERFKLLYDAMRPHDPNLQFVIAAWWRPDEPICRQIVQELNGKAALWDVHVGGDNLRDGEEVDRQLTQMQQLVQEWSPGTNLKACIFEENGDRHDLRRALGHAHILNVTQRHGDFVLMDCPANCLQPWQQNDNGWNQGQVFFTPDRVWGMPPFYAQQMAAANHLPLRVQSQADSPAHDLDVTATRSEDGSTLVLKVVNLGAIGHRADVELNGLSNLFPDADVWTLAGNLDATNAPDAPERIRSVHSLFKEAGARFTYDFAPHSYTILRFKATHIHPTAH